jgi:arylformamidase
MNGKIIDLSRVMESGKEPFKFNVQTYFVEELLPQFHRREDDWYILQEWEINSHVGTHVESPYHHLREGKDIAGLSLETLMGEAVVLDFRGRKPDDEIGIDDLSALNADIRAGDIVLIQTGYDRDYGKPDYGRPYVSLSLIDWLVERRIKCLGIDASGIERYKAEDQPCHLKLFSAGIPIIEELANLSDISRERFTFMGLPLRIKGADASPIRAIAIEEEDS